MKPVLIITNQPKNSCLRNYLKAIRHRALQTENIIEALKVTKYVAPGLVISQDLLNSGDLKLIISQIFNNPLAPCIPSIFYNAKADIRELSSFFNKKLLTNSNKVFIDPKLRIVISNIYVYEDYVGSLN